MHCQSAQLHEGVCFQTEIKETAQNHKKVLYNMELMFSKAATRPVNC